MYILRGILEEWLKDAQKGLEDKSLQAGKKVSSRLLEKEIKYVQELMKMLETLLSEPKSYREIVEILEKEKIFEQISSAIKQAENKGEKNNGPNKYIT